MGRSVYPCSIKPAASNSGELGIFFVNHISVDAGGRGLTKPPGQAKLEQERHQQAAGQFQSCDRTLSY